MKLLKSRWSFLAIALISICLLTGGFWWWNRGNDPSALRNTEGHLALGNPSNANRDENNYLLIKTQYISSYNNTKHIPILVIKSNWGKRLILFRVAMVKKGLSQKVKLRFRLILGR